LDKRHALALVEDELLGQFLGKLARRSSRVGFDLLNEIKRAADSLREFGLGQVERFAPPPQPVAERVRVFHPHPPALDVARRTSRGTAEEQAVRGAVRVFVRLIVLQIQTT
jgi:hypothetical protein